MCWITTNSLHCTKFTEVYRLNELCTFISIKCIQELNAHMQVPVPHFGIVLDHDNFHELAKRVEAAGIKFVVPVRVSES